MTISLSPAFNSGVFFNNLGTPLSGGKLFAYIAGSSSVLATTYDNDSGTPVENANPIVLNSSGRLPVSVWLTNGVNYHLVLTMPDGTTVLDSLDHLEGAPSTSAVASQLVDALAAYLPKTGGTVTGNLTVTGTSTLGTANVSTLTSTTSTLGTAAASTLTATLNANSAVISNVATPVASTDAANKAYADSVGALPTGTFLWFCGGSAPTGYLVCDGSSLERTTYAALYAVIGTTYGFADGTHFNLPDLRGYFVRGIDLGRGIDTDRVLGTNQADDNKAHTHALHGDFDSMSRDDLNIFRLTAAGTGDGSTVIDSSGTEARPKNVALLPIIKV